MSTPDAKTIARVGKLLAMARKLDGGEAVDAPRVLNRILARHGIAMADVIKPNQQRASVCFRWRAPHHGTFVVQLISKVLDTANFQMGLLNNEKSLYVELTPLEHAEVVMQRALLLPALDRHMKAKATEAITAFAMQHKIHPTPPNQAEPEPPVNPDVVDALMKIITTK